MALGQSFLQKPESLPVMTQHTHCGTAAVTEDEELTCEWIAGELFPADGSKSVRAFSKIDRLDRKQNLHLRGELDHLLLNPILPATAQPQILRRRP
jgi:hypothetical protein